MPLHKRTQAPESFANRPVGHSIPDDGRRLVQFGATRLPCHPLVSRFLSFRPLGINRIRGNLVS